jgi:hypothetical protein
MTRRLALHLGLLAGLALCLAPSAPGQSLDELWTEYPLYPAKSETTTPRAASATSLPAAEPKAWSLPLADVPGDVVGPATDSSGAVLWTMVALVSAGALGLAVLLFGRMGPAPAVSWRAPGLADRVARLAVVTRERSRRGGFVKRTRHTPPRRPRPRAPVRSSTPPPPPQGTSPASAQAQEEERRQELCTVRWWRGYVKSQFYAQASDAAGRRRVVARSPEFWWRNAEPPPRSGPALDAYKALLATLNRDAWEPAGPPAGHWYEATLARPEKPSLHTLAERLAREEDPDSGT